MLNTYFYLVALILSVMLFVRPADSEDDDE